MRLAPSPTRRRPRPSRTALHRRARSAARRAPPLAVAATDGHVARASDRPASGALEVARRPATATCSPSSWAGPPVRGLRHLRPGRPRSSRGRAGASRSTAAGRWRSSWSTAASRRSRCSSWATRPASRRSSATSSATRIAYLAALPRSLPRGRRALPRRPPGRTMVRMWVDRATFQPVLGEAVRLDVRRRHRRPQSAL